MMDLVSPSMDGLRFVDAVKEEHFIEMSLIHALGWRDTYQDYLPREYLDTEITDNRWVPVFRKNFVSGNGCHGLLLYNGDVPVSCINYCPARQMNCNAAYVDWGEIASFYTHPKQRGKGYGGLLFEEALRRLREAEFQNAFVFVLRENERARQFYGAHGFTWDGSYTEIPFPFNTILTDLQYVKKL